MSSLHLMIPLPFRIGSRILDPILLRQLWPKLSPRPRTVITCIECLVVSFRFQNTPFLEIPVQHRAALILLDLPRGDIGRELQRLVEVLADGGVDADGEAEVHGCVGDGTEDGGWAGNGPAYGVLSSEGPEAVFLRVVEVRLEVHTGVVFFLGRETGAKVDAMRKRPCQPYWDIVEGSEDWHKCNCTHSFSLQFAGGISSV